MIIDTHAHVNFNFFKEDADEVIQRALRASTWLINVGADYRTSERALNIANKYEGGVFAAVGLHPMHLFEFRARSQDYDFRTRGEELDIDAYEKLGSYDKVAAIGEIGLDYYHLHIGVDQEEIKRVQHQALWEQLKLARRLDKAVIIHCRGAHDDMIAVLDKFRRGHRDSIPANRPWGVMHCFSGSEDLAWKYFSLGLIVSFTGLVTFSPDWDDLIRKLPLDKFMVETDCPFMTPAPHRGKRNEPLYVRHVAERISEIKGLEFERVVEATTRNARRLFQV